MYWLRRYLQQIYLDLDNVHPQFTISITAPIARFMGPTWGSSGATRTQMGPMLAPWTLLSWCLYIHARNIQMDIDNDTDHWVFYNLSATTVIFLLILEIFHHRCLGRVYVFILIFAWSKTSTSYPYTANKGSRSFYYVLEMLLGTPHAIAPYNFKLTQVICCPKCSITAQIKIVIKFNIAIVIGIPNIISRHCDGTGYWNHPHEDKDLGYISINIMIIY